MKIRVGEMEGGGVQGAWLPECDSIPHVGQPQGWANLLGVTSM